MFRIFGFRLHYEGVYWTFLVFRVLAFKLEYGEGWGVKLMRWRRGEGGGTMRGGDGSKILSRVLLSCLYPVLVTDRIVMVCMCVWDINSVLFSCVYVEG